MAGQRRKYPKKWQLSENVTRYCVLRIFRRFCLLYTSQSIEAIHTYCGNQKQKLEDLDRYEENFRRAKAEVEKSRAQLEIVSDKLSVIRKKYSQMLTDKIIEGLKDLNFLDVQFHIDFQRKKEYTDNGFDDIEYEISTNPGESVKPVSYTHLDVYKRQR